VFLTAAELRDLTGLCRKLAQYRWLRENGWPVQRDAKGRPLVLRSVVEARLGATPSREPAGPNWEALRGPA
jgi:hypothetical protein